MPPSDFVPEWDKDKSLSAWLYVNAVGICKPDLYQKIINHVLYHGIFTEEKLKYIQEAKQAAMEFEIKRQKEQAELVKPLLKKLYDALGLPADFEKTDHDYSWIEKLIK